MPFFATFCHPGGKNRDFFKFCNIGMIGVYSYVFKVDKSIGMGPRGQIPPGVPFLAILCHLDGQIENFDFVDIGMMGIDFYVITVKKSIGEVFIAQKPSGYPKNVTTPTFLTLRKECQNLNVGLLACGVSIPMFFCTRNRLLMFPLH